MKLVFSAQFFPINIIILAGNLFSVSLMEPVSAALLYKMSRFIMVLLSLPENLEQLSLMKKKSFPVLILLTDVMNVMLLLLH